MFHYSYLLAYLLLGVLPFTSSSPQDDKLAASIGMLVADGKYAVVADELQHRLLVLESSSNANVRRLSLKNKDGQTSRVTAIYEHKKRQSVIVVLNDIAELWELSYNPKAEPVYQGWVHDYQMGEGIADTQLFAPRKTALELELDCFTFDASGNYAAGADHYGKLQIINLDMRRKIAELQFTHPVYPCESVIENTGSTSILHLKMKSSVAATTDADSSIILIDMKTGQRVIR